MTDFTKPPENYLLPIREVRRLTSLSNTELYRRMKAGRFPANIPLGPGRVAWWMSDVQAWMDALPRAAARKREAA